MGPLAKSTGLGQTTLSVDNSAGTPVDIRNDVNSWDIATPRAVIDVTGVDKSAMERLLGLADFTVTLNMTFNPTVSHLVFRTVPSTAVLRTTSFTVNATTLAGELLYTDYQVKRGNDGALTCVAPGSLADGTIPTWS